MGRGLPCRGAGWPWRAIPTKTSTCAPDLRRKTPRFTQLTEFVGIPGELCAKARPAARWEAVGRWRGIHLALGRPAWARWLGVMRRVSVGTVRQVAPLVKLAA